MKRFVFYLLVSAMLLFCNCRQPAMDRADSSQAPMRPVPVGQVQITDSFWLPRLQTYKERTLPHSRPFLQSILEEATGLASGHPNTAMQGQRWHESNLYKHLEAVAYALHLFPDQQLQQKRDSVIRLLASAQREDGYQYIWSMSRNQRPWANLLMQHEDFCMGHLYEAAAFQAQLGDTSLLDVARKSADHAHRLFITEDRVSGIPGHAGMELGLVELYRQTRQPQHLKLAMHLIERRGRGLSGWDSETGESGFAGHHYPSEYFQDHLPFEKQSRLRGHAVRAIYFLTGIVDVAIETGQPDYLEASRTLWENIATRKMSVTGSIGAFQRMESLGNDFEIPFDSHNESCAACGMANCAAKMLRIEPDATHADVLERVLYNGVLHGISLDGSSFFYRNGLTGDRQRGNPWSCCPPNIYRTLLGIGRYIYTQTDQAVFVNLYIGNQSKVSLREVDLDMRITGNYAWNGEVELMPNPSRAVLFPLYLRIPAWSKSFAIWVNGERQKGLVPDRGYVRIQRTWSPNDRVKLVFDPVPTRLQAHPSVFNEAPWIADYADKVAIQRGPFVYAVEGVDNEGAADVTLAEQPALSAEYRADFLTGIVVVTGKTETGKTFTAIPYFALANREQSPSAVWLSQAGKSGSSGNDWENTLYQEYSNR